MEFITNLIQSWEGIILAAGAAVGGLVGIATIVVGITPSQKDDAILEGVVKKLERWSLLRKKPTKRKLKK